MCGIFGYYCWSDRRPGAEVVRNMLLENQSRGRDAAGLAWKGHAGQVSIVKRKGPASELVDKIDRDMPRLWDELGASPIVIGHARARTKGTEDNNENNHPVIFNGWAVVHNGHVHNDDDLFHKAIDRGVERFAEVDTAAIPLVLAESGIDGLGQLGGSATLAAWNKNEVDVLTLARVNGPDLYLYLEPDCSTLFFSSAPASSIVPATDLGPLRFATVSRLPDDSALELRARRRDCRLFDIDNKPYVKPFEPKTYDFPNKVLSTGSWECQINWTNTNPTMVRVLPIFHLIGRSPSFSDFDRANIDRLIVDTGTPKLEVATPLGRWLVEVTQNNGRAALHKVFRPIKSYRALYDSRRVAKWWELPITDTARHAMDGRFNYEPIVISKTKRDGGISMVEPGYMCPICGVFRESHLVHGESSTCQWCYTQLLVPRAR